MSRAVAKETVIAGSLEAQIHQMSFTYHHHGHDVFCRHYYSLVDSDLNPNFCTKVCCSFALKQD